MIEICQSDPKTYGIICGKVTPDNQKYAEGLKKLINQKGLDKRILFLGELQTENLPYLFRSLDLYIAPQRWEGFGLTPIEAMSSGVPVIATRAGVFEEMIIEGETGYIVEFEDHKRIVEHTKNLIIDPELLNRMSINSRKKVVNDFNIINEATNLISVYEELAG